MSILSGKGGDLFSLALRRGIFNAEGFHGRVRDGIVCCTLAMTTLSRKNVVFQEGEGLRLSLMKNNF